MLDDLKAILYPNAAEAKQLLNQALTCDLAELGEEDPEVISRRVLADAADKDLGRPRSLKTIGLFSRLEQISPSLQATHAMKIWHYVNSPTDNSSPLP